MATSDKETEKANPPMGMSMYYKHLVLKALLEESGNEILIIDPEREYQNLPYKEPPEK